MSDPFLLTRLVLNPLPLGGAGVYFPNPHFFLSINTMTSLSDLVPSSLPSVIYLFSTNFAPGTIPSPTLKELTVSLGRQISDCLICHRRDQLSLE